MPNPTLTPVQREKLFKPLFAKLLSELEKLSEGDAATLWALRRKLAKELVYQERGTPAYRGKLKDLKREEQGNICPFCGRALPLKGAELDRIEGFLGYTQENTRLVHHKCHIQDQASKKYGC